MKKVCFFPGTMALGGIGKLFLNLIKEYATRDLAVDVFLTKKEGEFLEQIPPNVRVIEGNGRALTSIVPFIKYLNKEKPDVVISAREYLNIINVFCCACSTSAAKAAVSFHTNQTTVNSYKIANMQQRSIYRRKTFAAVAKTMYKLAPKIIAVSKGVADDVTFRLGVERSKIKVIYNPVYQPYKEEVTVPNIEFENFIKDKRRFIVGVGRLDEYKGFDLLIEAFTLVREKLDVTLVILGEGPEREDLEKQIEANGLKEHILLLGYVDNPLYYVSRAAVHVVASKFEGFGNTIVEALGVGVPVVSTDCPSGPAEILENGKYGKLVPVGNRQAMAAAIIETLQSEHDAAALVARAQDFAIPKIADEYLSYLYN